ncbi:AAA family ATPase [Thermobifida cellulosilytica]|jgi:hypothetical protein|uniref:ATPase AAA-type core domain-containing protein n=1 Tax=Thermobifida cellulosilytica TB100 TaxID=665004 RepID=A0A147KIE2_THECS|nr:ATP-binding protein [Thermobifida cellulosilytica]KUP97057.1 hypothetical protein AC529_08865 [Thermobifida cellulosilytica TB100]
MLLRFRVANHRSIRDEQELSLVAVPRRGEEKPKASEIPPTLRVVGIYGANASGKSNVLDALWWMLTAVRYSHTRWQPDAGVPRKPFQLDDVSRNEPSFYEVDFVFNGVRHSYGFEVTDREIVGEWLFEFPHGRPRRLFEREGPKGYRFGRALTGELRQIEKLTRDNSLYLSCAASNNHPYLSAVQRWLTGSISLATEQSLDVYLRDSHTRRMLDEATPEVRDRINRLIRVADLGVTGVSPGKRELDEKFLGLIRSIGVNLPGNSTEEFAENLRRNLEKTVFFTHSCAGDPHALPIEEESDGTRSWFRLIGPVLNVLEKGDVFLVDEIDSSLHPMISSTLIRMFKDPVINPKGAQIVFASHDTTLLGTMLENKLLERDEVWFTEKDARGATSLYSLAEFHPRGDENPERGYLQGRYGAVPHVNFEEIRSLFAEIHGAADEPSASPETGPLPAHQHP